MSRPLLPQLSLLALACWLVAPADLGAQTDPPKVFFACYVPVAGVVYRIKEPGLPQACRATTHVEFSWTDGLPGNDHGALNGLSDDDHPQYLLASGLRALMGNLAAGDFKLTGLGAATAPGDAVRFEQAVKSGDAAGGDLAGAYPNPMVAKLQGRAVAGTAPTAGQVLTFDGSAWAPAMPAASGGATDHGALTGLTDDDHPQYLLANGVRSAPNGFAVTGASFSAVIPTSGVGTRLMWYPRKAAFRAGEVSPLGNTTVWDEQNVGIHSAAMGSNTMASGIASTAVGSKTIASGNGSTAMGAVTTASGVTSTATGSGTTASGSASTAMGSGTTASAFASTAMGQATAASGDASMAIGSNTTASGLQSTAMGTQTTAFGRRSTAMGSCVSASRGSFIYGDESPLETGFTCSQITSVATVNSFWVRATGGFRFQTSLAGTDFIGCALAAQSGTFFCTSSREAKENFRDEDGEATLEKIARMAIQSWNYRTERPALRHLGPTAEDFRAAFGLGVNNETISLVDADGVNMLAIQALERRTAELRAKSALVDALEARVAELERRLAALEAALKR